jgi:hypothetical protein
MGPEPVGAPVRDGKIAVLFSHNILQQNILGTNLKKIQSDSLHPTK